LKGVILMAVASRTKESTSLDPGFKRIMSIK